MKLPTTTATATPMQSEVDEEWHELHDLMNLATLPFIIFTNLIYLCVDSSNIYFWLQFCIFAAYLAIDTLWVFVIPRSVASPQTILIHHLVTMVGWSLPILFGMHLAKWCAVGLLVEINTWLLIARRYFRNVSIFTPLFFATWVLFRLIIYPWIGYQFLILSYQEYREYGSIGFGSVIYIVLCSALTFLNFKWSYDLVRKNLRKGFTSEHSKGL
jgi:cellulose synthase/poly-beta-1,6-N-acetylglucosamine synthase-like glycosyltransferase